jgi:2-oxoglutarate dehydrogenase E1 component
MHIPDRDVCTWIRNRFESLQFKEIPKEKLLLNLDRILWTEQFVNFLENKFNTMKRFGIEGCETLIPGLKVCLDTLVDKDCEKVIIGMPHRGRLSVLVNVVRKPLEQIFSEF